MHNCRFNESTTSENDCPHILFLLDKQIINDNWMIYKDSEHISFFNRYRVLKVLHKSLNHIMKEILLRLN